MRRNCLPLQSTVLALLFILSAMGKSAQLPFSGWLPRAMEGPTPSSALFYGAVSIHAGLFLLLRVWPVLEVSPFARGVGILVGLSTAVYAASVVRVHTDAKGALAHATLAQVGLIMAEICLGWTTLALVHLVCHALLRLGQYLKAPNTIHDTHRFGHVHRGPSLLERWAPALAARVYAASLHRLRLDDRIDTAFAPVLALAAAIDHADSWLRRTVSLDRATQEHRNTGTQELRNSGAQERRGTDSGLGTRDSGNGNRESPKALRSTGALEHRNAEAKEHRNAGAKETS